MALFSRLAVTLRAGNHAVTRDWKSAQRPAVALRFFSTPASAPLTESPELDEEKKFKSYYARIVRKFSMLGLYQHAVDLEDLEAVIQRSMEYFMYRLGMSKLEAVRVISLHPMIATYSKETMDSKVDWMRRNGLTMAMISKATRNHPSWIGRSEASMEKIKNWLLAHGLAPSKIPFVLMVFPNGVSLKLDSLDAKVEYLKSVGVDDDHLRRILNRFPQMLTMGLDRIQLKVESLRAWGVPEERIPKIAAVVPEFFCLSMDKVHEKIKTLDKLYGDGMGLDMWMRMPRLVMYNTNQLERSHEYLTTVVGLKPEQITSSIAVLTRNVDRFIRPRYEYLTSTGATELASPVRWIMATKQDFIKMYPDFDDDQ